MAGPVAEEAAGHKDLDVAGALLREEVNVLHLLVACPPVLIEGAASSWGDPLTATL